MPRAWGAGGGGMSTSSIAVSAQPGCAAISLARWCVKANKVNASSATKRSPEAMMRAMILSLRADIVRADPHPLPPRGARVEKHEKNREKDDPRRGSQRIIDDRVQGDQADGKPGWNGIGAAARRIAHQPDSPHNQRKIGRAHV